MERLGLFHRHRTLTLRPSGTYSGIYIRQASFSGGSSHIACKQGITGTPGGALLFQQGGAAGSDTSSLTDSGDDTNTSITSHQTTTCQGGGACISGYLANAPANATWVEIGASSGDNDECNMIEVAGIATSSPLDRKTDAGGATGPYSSGGVTTTHANEIVIRTLQVNPHPGSLSSFSATGSWATATSFVAGGSSACGGITTQIVSTTQRRIANTGTMSGTGTLYYDAGIATFFAQP